MIYEPVVINYRRFQNIEMRVDLGGWRLVMDLFVVPFIFHRPRSIPRGVSSILFWGCCVSFGILRLWIIVNVRFAQERFIRYENVNYKSLLVIYEGCGGKVLEWSTRELSGQRHGYS